jgi:hypothetical protein
MTSKLQVDALEGRTTKGSIVVTGEGTSKTTNLQQGLAKVWIKADHTSTTNQDSFNVSSISDTATGKLQINFNNDFSSAHISITQANSQEGAVPANPATDGYEARQIGHDGSYGDSSHVYATVHGDLA